MKTFLSGLVMLVLVVGFSSCQKEIENPTIVRTGADSTIISRYIGLDTTALPGRDTIFKILFDYDAQGRFIRETEYFKSTGSSTTTLYDDTVTVNYVYKGTDTLPYKAFKVARSYDGKQMDTVYLFYQNQVIIKDSTRRWALEYIGGATMESIEVNKYVINASNVTATQYLVNTLTPAVWPPACPGTTVYSQTFLNGNITSETGAYTSCSGTGNSSFIGAYDNKPNPLYAIRIPFPILTSIGVVGSVQKNNVTGTGTVLPGDNLVYNYTYRSDGYPLIVRILDVGFPADSYKAVFVYK